jgi:hypothetical protein
MPRMISRDLSSLAEGNAFRLLGLRLRALTLQSRTCILSVRERIIRLC